MKPKENISICLNCYVIKFKERFQPDSETLPIKTIFGNDDLFSIYQSFVKTIDTKKAFRNKSLDRVLYLKETIQGSSKKNIVAGIIMKGHNGPETSIDELIKGEAKNVGKVTSEQFHCHPYFFLFYMKKEKPTELIFMAQSYRQFGFKEVFQEAFEGFVKNHSSLNVTVMFNTLAVASLFEKYVNDGNINKLRFIKHGLDKNAESVLFGDKSNGNSYEMELSLKSQKGFLGIKNKLKFDDASFIEQVKIDGFEFEEAFADIIIGGRKRVLNVTKPSEFSASYDITSQVEIDDKTKLPNFREVLSEAVDILNNDLIPFL